MADLTAFDFVCEELEQRSSLSRLEARGTVRLALKQAGLEARATTPAQMIVVCEKILPVELENRGIAEPVVLTHGLIAGLGAFESGAVVETADAVFRRIGEA